MRSRYMRLDGLCEQVPNSWYHRIRHTTSSPSSPIYDDVTWTQRMVDYLYPVLRGHRKTDDENHGFQSIRSVKPGTFSGDIGGPFTSRSSVIEAENASIYHIWGKGVSGGSYTTENYFGPVLACNPNSVTFPTSNESNLTPLGTTAIARCRPTRSVANTFTDFSEAYFQGLPHILGHTLWKQRVHQLHQTAADEFLNVEFGWKPLVSDIRKSISAIGKAHKILESYEANSGKVVRRRYEFPVEESEVTVDMGAADPWTFSGPSSLSRYGHPTQHLFKTTRTYRRTWFSGGFTYHLPTGYKSRWWLARTWARAGPLLGIELTPATVWQASPWTWAANWFSNMGDVMNNLSDWATDGLVLKWGYIMQHCVVEVTYTLVGDCGFYSEVPIHATPIVARFESKRRVRATPFGFGLTWNTLSVRQLAIAAALGIKRVF